ncbi:MAG TPA: hypothetical protein GXX67_12625 [Petrimonas sp.]|nr:hypothetical protein [Petrimonas sp.]
MTLDDINEVALAEEPSYLDFLTYLVQQEIDGRDNTQKQRRLKKPPASRPGARWTNLIFLFRFQ